MIGPTVNTIKKQSGIPEAPTMQSELDRMSNYHKVAHDIVNKMIKHPENITKEDAALLHSREDRFLNSIKEHGTLSSRVQHQVAINLGDARPHNELEKTIQEEKAAMSP